MVSRVCCLCRDLVEAKRATNLFSAVGMQNNWVRITSQITLLKVAITNNWGKRNFDVIVNGGFLEYTIFQEICGN